jgi:predicted DNA-binding antitoxin AbrB/MazE fold protein
MKETFEAIYEKGVLRPLRSLRAREGQRVRVSLETDFQELSSDETQRPNGYDFSDLIGRLMWRGDPLAEQKRIRDEWR